MNVSIMVLIKYESYIILGETLIPWGKVWERGIYLVVFRMNVSMLVLIKYKSHLILGETLIPWGRREGNIFSGL